MLNLFHKFDGSDREPREQQRLALEFVQSNIREFDVIAIQAPTGTGKTAIAKAIQDALGANIIVSSNVLMSQYIEQYPEVNYLKGKEHYKCNKDKAYSCADMSLIRGATCSGCPYVSCKTKAVERTPTIFNPISLYNLTLNSTFESSKVVVIDEAHEFMKMLLLLSAFKFPSRRFDFPLTLTNEFDTVTWVRNTTGKLIKLHDQLILSGGLKRAAQVMKDIERLEVLGYCLSKFPEKYSVFIERENIDNKSQPVLNLVPIEPPETLVKRILGCDKLILLSATLLKTDVEAFAYGQPYAYIDLPSPIPKERRAVQYLPSEDAMNYLTDPKVVVREIERAIAMHPGMNTIIHVTYSWSERLKPLMPYALTNTPATKEATIKKFKRLGGIFLAAGCSEGIDLPGKECELNIIPIMMRPNLIDPAVRKRKALSGGQLWYDLETIKLVIQQAGRSTRFEKDHSYIYILDPRFPELVTNCRENIPSSFLESVRWSVCKPNGGA